MNNNTPFWIMIAREGETTDGRYISAETLIGLAKSYSPDFYCAHVYKDHRRQLGEYTIGNALGKILAAKTELQSDSVCLYVQIGPIECWFSVLSMYELQNTPIYPALEYLPNMAVIAAPYITGMALTTEPAIKNLEPLNKHMVKA